MRLKIAHGTYPFDPVARPLRTKNNCKGAKAHGEFMTKENAIASHDEWTSARVELLQKEKEFLRLRDELSRQVRSLPWEQVEKTYAFVGPDGTVGLADLFGSKSQLIIYHFMFDKGWAEGCPSCSIITDSLNPTAVHLRARDVAIALVSRAPIEKLQAFKKRMGWKLDWVSSLGTDFNQDFQACTDAVTDDGKYYYNYEMMSRYPQGEQPGLSVFKKDSEGRVYHTYSTYARGLEAFVGTYSLLNVVPKGRDEDALDWGMAWVRRRDEYEEEQGEA